MNFRDSFQMPRQSFPTDVTSPAPTQLPGNNSEAPPAQVSPEPNPPQPRDESEQQREEEERAA
jgi:hypothetical protein